jgi:hypothetical protein
MSKIIKRLKKKIDRKFRRNWKVYNLAAKKEIELFLKLAKIDQRDW